MLKAVLSSIGKYAGHRTACIKVATAASCTRTTTHLKQQQEDLESQEPHYIAAKLNDHERSCPPAMYMTGWQE